MQWPGRHRLVMKAHRLVTRPSEHFSGVDEQAQRYDRAQAGVMKGGPWTAS